jgi:hypothetical protein
VDELLLRGAVIGSTLAYACAEWLRFRRPASWRASRTVWTLGAALLVLHSAAAFHVRHRWSHADALASTAAQTAALTGWHWGGGLYANYAFIALWMFDAGWWWVRPASYPVRTGSWRQASAIVFLFMFANGAVVFAHGAVRAFGAACVAAAALAYYSSVRRTA